jgi:hypothetical protein
MLPMRQATYLFLLAFLVLSFLTDLRSESLDDYLHFFPAAAIETEAAPTDVEPVSGPSAWHPYMKSITPRWKGTSALISVPLQSITARDASPRVHLCPSSSVGTYQTTPLYQSLQVFRF